MKVARCGVVDLDVEAADPGQRPAGDHDVVEREVADGPRRTVGLPTGQDASLEGEPLVDPVVAVDDSPEHVLELARLGLRQEPDLAEVDAHQRDVHFGHGSGGPQERAVAAQHDERVRRRQLAQEGLGLARRRLPFVDPAHLAPAGGPGAQLDGRLDRRVVGEPDPRDGHAPVASAIRSPISAQPGPGARWSEEFPVALGPGERRGDDGARPDPEPAGHATIRSRTSRWTAGSRTTPWSVRPRPASNCGLTKRDDLAARPKGRGHRGEDQRERDERDVDRREGDGLRERRGGQLASVRPLHRDDPRVAAERFGELSAAHVESVDPARTALQQDVREAAGGRTDVETDEPRRVDLEGVQGRRELVAAPADVGVVADDLDRAIGQDEVARLAIVTCRVALPHPDLAGQHQRLRSAARLDQATLDEQLVESDARDPDRGCGAHPPIVAQPAFTGTHTGRLGRPTAVSSRRPPTPGVPEASRALLADLLGQPGRVQPEDAPQVRDRPVIHEPLARDPDDPQRHVAVGRVGQPRLLEQLQDAAAEPAGHDALLERHDQPLAAGLVQDQLAVERPGEPGVDDPDRPALGLERLRPPRAPGRRSARSPRTGGRAPRAAPRPARPGSPPASRAAGRSRHRAGSAARTDDPGRARCAGATEAPARPWARRSPGSAAGAARRG